MPHPRTHDYQIDVTWTGNRGTGTSGYRDYSRDHEIAAAGKPSIPGTSDPAFRGDPTRYSPEDLLVASLSACHMLWYLHLCADAGIAVVEYVDRAVGKMEESSDGGGRFTEVVLAPLVRVRSGADTALAESLHDRAHEKCFVASSVNFPVLCRPVVEVAEQAAPTTV